ncbi:DUF58 domain-containing protein [Salinibaculum sp. GCM10025337]
MTLSAAGESHGDLGIDITGSLPVGVGGEMPTLSLSDEARSDTSAALYWPVAGEFTFEQPQVTFSDRYGLFTQRVSHGKSPTVRVEPRAPRDIHVGQAGDRQVTGFGEHETGDAGTGITPSDVRKYVPGDTVSRIDWKATARLAEPHIREFELETDRDTKIFLDHRASTNSGEPGRTKLDYLRQIALAIVNSGAEYGDPIGCYTVGNEGITAQFEPVTTETSIASIRATLVELSTTSSSQPPAPVTSSSNARARAEALAAEDSSFARTLTPFFSDQQQYVRRVKNRPLFAALTLSQQSGSEWSVILTDDTARSELRESVKLARESGGYVTVYLTPSVLFRTSTVRDVATAYEQYVEFEAFRHELDSLERVSAFEVGPRDRLQMLLQHGRSRRQVLQT